MSKILRNYVKLYDDRTICQFISRWASLNAPRLKPFPPPVWTVQDPPDWRKTLNRLITFPRRTRNP
ncbi:lysis system o-spanin lipoprotein Rz1 [Xenorhabdus griffiniae]|uniref:Lysis system o-spanin lipoprotein Rz1 n=2 Tax=Xenorhabdus griffiniae TaxID=351672 RepID=A0ABY9XNF5_9GAMM|nr:Rz1 family lipoprotein [Xenorhabdus griffiniae]WMV74465.1 lysis system o-spanin lipoprotein Rz1 [Xenorhabdus griffiniae]WNH04143.1 lysis system o-spanin lipoprotein Rz1 [Xenorhabdus griffiniae]